MAGTGELTNEGADFALNFLLRNTGSSPTVLYFGLATTELTDTTDLATVIEPVDASYARQAVSFSAPANDTGVETCNNSNQLTFDFTTGGIGIVGGFLTDAASGTTGKIYVRFSLGSTKYTQEDEPLIVNATTLEVGIE